jgi:hypothetical protein
LFKNKEKGRRYADHGEDYVRRDRVTGEWRRLRCEELHALYSSPDIIWVMGRSCSKYGETEGCIQDFGGETRGKETTYKTQALMGE